MSVLSRTYRGISKRKKKLKFASCIRRVNYLDIPSTGICVDMFKRNLLISILHIYVPTELSTTELDNFHDYKRLDYRMSQRKD